MGEAALEVDAVSVRFAGRLALEDVSFVLESGAMAALVGPNGAGKTTLLEVVAGARPAGSGTVRTHARGRGDVALMRQTIAARREAPLTVAGFVAAGLWPRVGLFGAPRAADAARVRAAIGEAGLSDVIDRPVAELSIGQRQRAAFARAMVQDARLLLLDEPFAAIDAAGADRLSGLLEEWRARGCTVLAALHDLSLVRRRFPITILLARRIIAAGPTAEVLTPANLDAARRALDADFDDALCSHPHGEHEHAHGPAATP